MKIIRSLPLAAIVVIMALTGCGPAEKSNHHDLRWLTGTWADTSSGYREEWHKQGSKYIGTGYTLAGDDTLLRESLQIMGTDGWTYYASVEDQNDGRNIPFRLVNYDPDSLVFMNLNHDFPNLIVYSKRSDTVLHVIVSSEDGKRAFHLDLKKIAP